MLLSDLAALETAGLITLVNSQPELEYIFRHTLIQEVAYDSLLKSDRRELHQAVAEALERAYPQQLGELAPVLGRHYDEAGNNLRALKYLVMAGDEAASVYANSEAVAYYTRSLEIARLMQTASPAKSEPDDAGELFLRLYQNRGRALELSHRYDDADQNYVDMIALARERGDRSLELNALIARTTIHATPSSLFNPQVVDDLITAALDLATELGDQTAVSKVLWNLLLFNFFNNRPAAAREFGERSLAIARDLNLTVQLAYTLNDLGNLVYAAAGQFEEALKAQEEASAIWQATGNTPMLADSRTNLAFVYLNMGDFEKGKAEASRAYQISQEIGNLWGQAYSLGMLGYFHKELGEVDQAIHDLQAADLLAQDSFVGGRAIALTVLADLYGNLGLFDRGLEVAGMAAYQAENHTPVFLAQALSIMALLYIWQGNLNIAEEKLTLARANAQDETNYIMAPMLPLVTLELQLHQGSYPQVVDQADAYVNELRQHHVGLLLPLGLSVAGKVRLFTGQLQAARKCFVEAVSVAERSQTRHSWWRALSNLAAVEEKLGDREAAQGCRRQAAQVIDYIADHISSEELRAHFLNSPEVLTLHTPAV
jgi:tetratricopeptide (TPR) repeat protein